MDHLALIYRGTPPNLLCCDTTLRRMPNGDWVTFLLSGGPVEPHPDNGVFACRSRDRGHSWDAPVRLFPEISSATTPSEVFVLGDRVTMVVSTHNGRFADWRTWLTVSEDFGITWGPWSPFPHRPRRSFARTLLRLRSGRLLLPYQYFRMAEGEEERLIAEERYIWETPTVQAENGVLISDDSGATWACSESVLGEVGQWHWPENNVAELTDGTLAMLIRVDGAGVLMRTDSHDGGYTWTPRRATDIPNPGAKFRLFTLADGRIALLHNPAPAGTNCMTNRNPLSLWISGDNLRTWGYRRDLVTFPGWLSYPDGFLDEAEGYIHFAFDYNRHDAIYVGAQLPE
jgi:predicted neuraminidase